MVTQLLPGRIAAEAVFNCRVWPEPEQKSQAASVCVEGVREASAGRRRGLMLASLCSKNPCPSVCSERPHSWISLLKEELGWRN